MLLTYNRFSGLFGTDDLLTSFISPSSEAKPWVYWYWLNGFVTKEGITADLESMNRAGIGGVIQIDPHLPTPNTILNAKYMTPQWWGLIRYAMQEANRLGIKFDIADGAGWSGSGGNWIRKEDAMEFVVTSETQVTGPSEFNALLPNPPARDGFSKPVAVIAIPTIPGDDIAFDQHVKTARIGNSEVSPASLFDHDLNTGVTIPAVDTPSIEFQLDKTLTIQSVVVSFKNGSAPAGGELEVSGDGVQYHKVAGFTVLHPVHLPNYFTDRASVNFSPVATRYLRILFKHATGSTPISIQELGVSGSKRIEDFPGKAGYVACAFPYNPLAGTDAESAAPKASVIDLSSKMDKDGKLTWSVPRGSWTIIRVASTITGSKGAASQLETRGLDVDKFSKEAMDHHWRDGVMKRIVETAKTPAGKNLYASHIDSWEVGEQNWTPKMREEFTRRRGYDPLPYFPIFTGRLVESQAVTERFLWDYRLTIADLYSENYFGHFADLCKKNGLLFTNEPYGAGANFDYITSGSHADIPMGEFGAWIDATSPGDMEGCVKMAASVGHTYNRPIIQCESFTSGMPNSGYLGHPYRIKSMGDYQYTLGCNRTVLHVYAMQPWVNDALVPGMTLANWGTQFGRNVTWWDMAGPWIKCLTRTCSVLQQGRHCADVCVFQGEEEVPNTGIFSHRSITPPLPSGYDFDVCDTPTLLNRLEVNDGRLILPGGISYRFLVLQKSKAMTPAMLRKVGKLIKAGAVVIGDKPAWSLGLGDYPDSDTEVRNLAAEIWGDCDGVNSKEHAYGMGRVICGKAFEEIFSEAGLAPDFAYHSSDPRACVNFTHRRNGNAEIYYLANWKRNICETTSSFRVSNLLPEIWNPETGQLEKCMVYKQVGTQTEIPVRFDPSGSLFVVFRHPAQLTIPPWRKSRQPNPPGARGR